MLRNIIDRVKLTFKKDHELASALYKILGFYPHNIDFYRMALAHKSQGYRNPKFRASNNERLEFLGDAVLEAVVSDIVFHRYDSKREGFLTNTRSKIVQRSSLNKLAAEIGLNRLIRTAGLSHTHNNNIGGNAFEALVGAIYLDRGYTQCQKFIEKRIIGAKLDIDSVAKKEVNFKSKLLEWTQKNRLECDYTFDVHEDNDAHSPVFNSTVVIEGVTVGRGQGYSKKESQQFAAKDALKQMRRDPELADSVYRGKEKRTAMEADEVCALPKIDEIEAEIAREKAAAAREKAARPAAPKNKQQDRKRDNADRNRERNKAKQQEAKTQEAKQQEEKLQAQEPKPQESKPQRSSRNARRAPRKEKAPAEAEAAPAQAEAIPAEAESIPRVETVDKVETVETIDAPESTAPSAPAEPQPAPAEQPQPAPAEEAKEDKKEAESKPEKKPRRRSRRAPKSAEPQPAEEKPAEEKSAEAQPAANEQAESKGSDSTEANSAETAPAPRPRRSRRRKPATPKESPAAQQDAPAAPQETVAPQETPTPSPTSNE